MAAANSTTTANTAQDIQPVFKRVQQTGTHDCIFACVAMIAGKPLEEVISVAVSDLKHPRHGPFWPMGGIGLTTNLYSGKALAGRKRRAGSKHRRYRKDSPASEEA